MVLFINTQAAGGTALTKWKNIETEFLTRFHPSQVHLPRSIGSMNDLLRQAIDRGERNFVAAGGDGTVNALLNGICTVASSHELPGISLGAVGLGSSNDFHKPFLKEQFVGAIPCKVDFQNAFLRDVGRLSFEEGGHRIQRYFLANASSGVTAEANRFFNNPSAALEFLKRVSTEAAILYAAVRTILKYNNFECSIQTGRREVRSTRLTNLAVMKNPHVSGSFLYDTPVVSNDGFFAINLSESMSKPELLRLLYSLSRGKFTHLNHTQSWLRPFVKVSAPEPMVIEFDGEIVTTRSATFTVLPEHLKVCP